MNFWKRVVSRNSIPTKPRKKLRYNAELLTGSVITQEYHIMIQEGLKYSYVTNCLALFLLHVPYDNPTSLYYHLCVPNQDVNPEDDQSILQPTTAIARVLCLCLMSFHSQFRDQSGETKHGHSFQSERQALTTLVRKFQMVNWDKTSLTQRALILIIRALNPRDPLNPLNPLNLLNPPHLSISRHRLR